MPIKYLLGRNDAARLAGCSLFYGSRAAQQKRVLFETYYEDWQHFSDWNFDDMGENIIINYSYLDYNDNWEYDSIEISLDKVIEMI